MLCALSVLPAKAYEGIAYYGGTTFFYNNVDGGVEITNNPGLTFSYNGEIEIPAELAGKKVVAIGYNAFASCNGLTSVTIPTGVKKIDSGAFANCNNLNTLTLRTGEIPEVAATAFEGTYLGNSILKTYPRYADAETLKNLGFNKIQTDITYDGSVEVVTEIELADPLHMTYYYYEFADGVEITYNTYEGKGYESYPGNLYIPSEINGKPVIGISDYAFSGCT
ncbi:MAG: leucine-rich repeat protein, partial [Muribaculaceae bacterium]|nr:leucine-rich repeat protein [Muribaculaceae bacterium]